MLNLLVRFRFPILILLFILSNHLFDGGPFDLTCTFAQALTSQGGEQNIPYTGSTAFILSNSPVNPNLLVNTGINTFIMAVNPPSNSARIYITNETANACSNLTVTFASSGNSTLSSFNFFPQAWQSVLLQVGQTAGFNTTATFTLPASGSIALTSAAIIGSKVALFVVLSSGCATTNIDVQVVFGAFSSVSPNIQGIIPTGQNGASENPVVCGGLDQTNLVQPCGVYKSNVSAGSAAINGLAIGAPNQGLTAGFSGVTNANGNGGPLGVIPAAAVGVSNPTRFLTAQGTGIYTASKDCSSSLTTNCSGFYISQAGIGDNESLVTGTVGTNNVNFITYAAGNGTVVAVRNCRFSLDIGAVATASGTGTIDFYAQDSDDNINWTDRVHFPQIATSTTPASAHFWASVDSAQVSASCTAGTCTTGAILTKAANALAVNTVITGAPGKFLRFSYVVAGNAVTFTGGAGTNTFGVYCQ